VLSKKARGWRDDLTAVRRPRKMRVRVAAPPGRHFSLEIAQSGVTGRTAAAGFFAGAFAVTSSLLPTYARFNLAFERGEGAWLYATNGDKYLDFGAGIAVVSVGHCHPHLV